MAALSGCTTTIRQTPQQGPGGVRGAAGQILLAPPTSPERASALARQRAEDQASCLADLNNQDALIWYGRRLAYEHRYGEAIDVFSVGLARHPGSSQLLRHRGHRYITTRRFDLAVADLTAAADLASREPDAPEADGAPNPAGIPRSTRHSNISYHLGLAHFLRGAFDLALEAYDRDLGVTAVNDDMRVSHGWWTWLALRRAAAARGSLTAAEHRREAELLASITPDMQLLENHAYHQLLLLAKGALGPEDVLAAAADDGIQDATRRYGVAAWHLAHGRRDEGLALCRQLADSPWWMSFGVIAAEAELTRDG